MKFPFDAEKITQAAILFLQLEGNKIEVLKQVKRLYLSEREALKIRPCPIYGGLYYSLPHGPITSEGLNLIDGQGLKDDQSFWDRSISTRNGNWLTLVSDSSNESLSRSEIKIIESVYAVHGSKTAWQLRNWCHENLPEYEEITKGRIPITLKEIGIAVESCPSAISDEASAQRFLGHVLAS